LVKTSLSEPASCAACQPVLDLSAATPVPTTGKTRKKTYNTLFFVDYKCSCFCQSDSMVVAADPCRLGDGFRSRSKSAKNGQRARPRAAWPRTLPSLDRPWPRGPLPPATHHLYRRMRVADWMTIIINGILRGRADLRDIVRYCARPMFAPAPLAWAKPQTPGLSPPQTHAARAHHPLSDPAGTARSAGPALGW
jgi:hypothetical protein